MRIPSVHHDNEVRENATMTPMIDIVFLLLIFFVCASVGQVREGLLATQLAAGTVDTPETIERKTPLGEVWIHLRWSETRQRTVVEVNDREYSDFAELQSTLSALAELASEIPVILDIDPDVPLGDMIRVYDTCRAADFQSIHFATDAEA